MLSVDTTVSELRNLFDGAARRNPADCILLSGGLDTSIVALNAHRYSNPAAVTVCLGQAPDERFAKLIAQRFGLEHTVVRIDERDAEGAIRGVVCRA